MADYLVSITPGISERLPARYDALGKPILSRSFLSVQPNDPTERELARLAALGYGIEPPTPTINHADLRDVTRANGEPAWPWYQQLAGQPTPHMPTLKDQIGKIIDTPAYEKAPDGAMDVKGTKLFMLHGPVVAYHELAKREIMGDKNVRTALQAAQMKAAAAYQQVRSGGAQVVKPTLNTLNSIVGQFGVNLGANPPAINPGP
ncbi:MAG TPA: hypothetical protein VHW60_17765 [Caulobacteraceae bacterium]|nr:hypothetical protein [Caulobacteraceae bacterium]